MELATEADIAGETDDGVAVTTQALGGWENIWTMPSGVVNGLVMKISEGLFALATQGSGSCDTLHTLIIPANDVLTLPALPCMDATAIAIHGSTIFVGGGGRIVKLTTTMKPAPSWQELTSAPSGHIGAMFADQSYVYWMEASTIYRVSMQGAVQTMYEGASRFLGVDSGTVYLQTDNHPTYTLRRVTPSLTKQKIATLNRIIYELSFDANFFYWADNGAAPHRINKMTKAGQGLTIVTSSATLLFQDPTPFGGRLYWHEGLNDFGSVDRVRSMTLSNGSIWSVDAPTQFQTNLHVTSSGVYLYDHFPDHGGFLYEGSL